MGLDRATMERAIVNEYHKPYLFDNRHTQNTGGQQLEEHAVLKWIRATPHHVDNIMEHISCLFHIAVDSCFVTIQKSLQGWHGLTVSAGLFRS